MKKVLGLDIGTNSIGGALINLPEKFEDYGKEGNIEWLGSRIIPMDGDYLQKFESGALADTKAAFRRGKRGSRRLKHRYKLRRARLIKIFKALGWIDETFPLDESRKFKQSINKNGYALKISDYLPFSKETVMEFEQELGISGSKSKKGKSIVPEDWIVYFLRKKALEKLITIPELVRIIYMLNQRRGFKSSRKDLKDTNVLPYDEFIKRKKSDDFGEEGIETQFVSITKIKSVTFKEEKKVKKGKTEIISNLYTIEAEDPRMLAWEETRIKEPDWAKEVNDKGEKITKKEFTFLVIQKVDKNGKHTQNKPQIPKETDWALCTTALSEKIQENNQHPGEYFYAQIKEAYKTGRNFKARQFPVYRWRYQKELAAIWNKQCDFNPELKKLSSDNSTLKMLVEMLYPAQTKNNMPKLAEFLSKDLLHIISNDVIYYQRELKSQKNSINECRYEKRKGIDGELYGLKCIPRSSPLFQEFRIWQDIHNIRILEREVIVEGKTKIDIDVTNNFINDEIKEKLFDLFNSKTSISEKDILTTLIESYPNSNIKLYIDKKEKIYSHRINLYAKQGELKGNQILSRYRTIFKKTEFQGDEILSDKEKLLKLWHIDYSISSSDEKKSEKGIMSALGWKEENNQWTKTEKWGLFKMPESVALSISKLPELKKEFGSFSACAIKKLLPVMRCGKKYWNEKDINEQTKERINKIIDAEFDENISNDLRKKIRNWEKENESLNSLNDFRGFPTWLAGYIVYGVHSEKNKASIYSTEEFGKYIQKEIPNNSLRNPVVEQVVRETMFLVRDIWNQYGQINEIHIELGRNLKNNSAEREQISKSQTANFEEKKRIKTLLYELMNGFEQYVDDNIKENAKFVVKPNPESPADIDKFRIWRGLNKQSEFEWAKKVKDEKIPTEQEIKKYALWLSQNCRSPYTGKIIPLSKLFDTNQYEIEHIIPRKKMKNDSFNNLVISEWGVNKAKGSQLAANFISTSKGKCKYGDTEYTLFTYEEYEVHCKDAFKFQKSKLKNLLATEVPEDFVERQLNDTRYIGRKLSELLAPVAKNENGIIFTGGVITSELKNNWGLNKVWKDIIKPRFERLEEITGNTYIVNEIDEYGNPTFHFNVKENEKLDTKRIDHRHHALDALIIAATTREHIRYLNTLNAADTNDEIKKYRQSLVKGKIRDFKQPWETFTKEVKDELEKLLVSFKTNNKIVSQPKNKTAYFKVENGKAKKEFKEQKANPKWMSVRKSMFKEPQGIIYLKEVHEEKNIGKAIEIQIDRMRVQNTPEMKIAPYIYDQEARKIIKDLIEKTGIPIQETDRLIKEIKKYIKKNPLKDVSGQEYEKIKIATFEEYAAKRVTLDKSFDHKKIDKIPYAKIGKSVLGNLLHEHLDSDYSKNEMGNADPAKAFSNEGLEILAKKAGRPITKVTIYEKKDESSKFGKQYVEVDSGSNVYFVMYENKQTKERTDFRSIATHKAIEKIVKGEPIAEDKNGYDKIILSPGDLVYVPTDEEREGTKKIDWNNRKEITKSIYKMTDTTQGKCMFVPHRISSAIIDDTEIGTGNKSQRAWNGKVEYMPDSKGKLKREDSGTMIKDVCIKLNIDRIGNVSMAYK
jgi:CRISPR-associated endonuclease Csn1